MQRTFPRGSTLLLGLLAACGCHSTAPSTSNTEPPPTHTRPPQAGSGSETVPEGRETVPEGASLQPRSGRRRRGRASAVSAQPGDFDFYLLTLSWSPQFCASHPSSPECAAHPGFVVHGLWPQNNDGTYPENCSNAPGPANPGSDTDILPTVSLVQHEWQTHGTCSGLAADAYFNTVRQAFHEIVIPPSLRNVQAPQTVAPQIILQQFASANPSFPANAFVLSCGNNALTAVEVCLTKSLAGETCPNVRTCGATVIQVTPQ